MPTTAKLARPRPAAKNSSGSPPWATRTKVFVPPKLLPKMYINSKLTSEVEWDSNTYALLWDAGIPNGWTPEPMSASPWAVFKSAQLATISFNRHAPANHGLCFGKPARKNRLDSIKNASPCQEMTKSHPSNHTSTDDVNPLTSLRKICQALNPTLLQNPIWGLNSAVFRETKADQQNSPFARTIYELFCTYFIWHLVISPIFDHFDADLFSVESLSPFRLL